MPPIAHTAYLSVFNAPVLIQMVFVGPDPITWLPPIAQIAYLSILNAPVLIQTVFAGMDSATRLPPNAQVAYSPIRNMPALIQMVYAGLDPLIRLPPIAMLKGMLLSVPILLFMLLSCTRRLEVALAAEGIAASASGRQPTEDLHNGRCSTSLCEARH